MYDQSPPEDERIYSVRRLPICVEAPGEARKWAADVVAWWGMPDVLDDLRTVISELVTNSLQAGAQAISALIEWHRPEELVGVLVWDDGPGQPQRQKPDFVAESGRGLFLVEELSATWGHHPGCGGGKIVWARLPLMRSDDAA